MQMPVVRSCFFLLLLLCICLSCRGCLEEERDALLQIKTSINSPEGTAFSSWYGQDCCQWDGVECDQSKTRVNSILFEHQRDESLLEDWYPNATLFAQFKDLKELRLSGNRIAGFTPPHELQKLQHLQTLDLHDNSITNASYLCWGSLPSLHSLDLFRNMLLYIPECLCDTLSLTELILSDNNLHGRIPSCLSNITSLQILELSHNLFNGSFPSSLVQNLTRIESLILSENQFQGRVSFSVFANLSRVSQLDISHNSHLELETEAPTWAPLFNLKVLNLAGCNLRSIPSFFFTQNRLESLDLSDNLLSGPFPWNISSRLISLYIYNNRFHGPLPADIDMIFPKLFHLHASHNDFSGSIPPSFGRLKRLVYLGLSGNKLLGQIPTSPSFPKLRFLDLGGNNFTVTFLDSHRNLSQSLVFPQLRVLVLRSTRLEGQIPRQLCQMRNLFVLDLSNNNLTGDIPDCIGSIYFMTAEAEYQGRLLYFL